MMKNDDIIKKLKRLPNTMTLEEAEACFILASLAKNQGNKTQTCKKIRMSIRNMRMKLKNYEEDGYYIPPYVRVYKRKGR
jgi:DNA-binding NtrC family response regulator